MSFQVSSALYVTYQKQHGQCLENTQFRCKWFSVEENSAACRICGSGWAGSRLSSQQVADYAMLCSVWCTGCSEGSARDWLPPSVAMTSVSEQHQAGRSPMCTTVHNWGGNTALLRKRADNIQPATTWSDFTQWTVLLTKLKTSDLRSRTEVPARPAAYAGEPGACWSAHGTFSRCDRSCLSFQRCSTSTMTLHSCQRPGWNHLCPAGCWMCWFSFITWVYITLV